MTYPWQRAALLFALASFIETMGFGHLGAFTPLYLEELGIPPESVPQWTGILASATWVLGLPLAPMWGVWADRYSRKLVIVRSTLGEGLIFFLFGIAGAPWQLLVARLLVGFILGNTGVMYAVLADLTPRQQLPTAIAFITAGSTLGLSVGPFVGGWLVTQIGVSQLYVLDGFAAWIITLVLIVGLRETRTRPRSQASSLELLRALPKTLRASPAVLPLFGLYFVAFLGNQMQAPFLPLLVADVYHGDDLPLAIGTVLLVTGVTSAVCAPLMGRLAGRFGAGRVLTVALVAGSGAALMQALAPDYATLLVSRAALGLCLGGMVPLIVSMIAESTPADRRAAVLNITLFPSYLGFILGAGIGSALVVLGIRVVFGASALVLLLAGALTPSISRRVPPASDPQPG